MSENKFIAKLKGEPTPKSVVEIQNDRLVAPFKSSPMGHIADRDSSVVVAKGAQNWAVNQGQLVPVADDYVGTESDLTATSRVSGAGLWLNATYTFPATGDETNPVSAIIAPSAKWVLTLCGDSLITQNGSVITLTMLVKIGATHLTTKQFKVRECASQFSQRLAIDFSESEQKVIKAHGGSPLTVQVLCDDEGASATIYSGMTHLTLLQRKIDADLVSTDNVLLPEFIENLLEGYIIPADYFSRYDYIEQVEDGGRAMPEFTRNGDDMTFSGWAKPATEVYTKTEIDNKFTVANAQIDANATAIVKTRDDMNAEDSRLQTQITAHAGAITALQNEQTATGNQIQTIESKIPDGTSETNPLINKQQLLDEEMDIRDDLNEMASELQTQITAQAAEIATKQDQLIAGDNIIISNNIISATGAGGGAGFDIVVVQELPATGQKGIIYLLAKDGTAPDVYDEYVWITATQTFELIGSTKVDLSGYLPTDGGTITGPITLGMTGDPYSQVDILKSSSGASLITGTTEDSGTVSTLGIRTPVTIFKELLPLANVGQSFSKVPRIYVEKINNGTDLSIPTQGDSLLANNSTANRAIATGLNATATQGGTAIGADSQAGSYAVAVGDLAKATGKRSVQLGKGTNADAGTLKFGNDSGNYTVLDVNGIVPAERMSSTTGTTGQVLTKTDAGMEWQEAPASGTKVIIKRYN